MGNNLLQSLCIHDNTFLTTKINYQQYLSIQYLFDLRLDLLSSLFRLLSRRLSLFLSRLYLSFLDLFLFFRLSSLEELVSDDEDVSESESLSVSEDSVSESKELSDSEELYLLFFLLSFADLLCFPFPAFDLFTFFPSTHMNIQIKGLIILKTKSG